MCAALDVVFVDGDGRVLRVLRQLPPWRVAFEARARAIFEFRGGLTQVLGIEPGTALQPVMRHPHPHPHPHLHTHTHTHTHTHQRGSAALEFVLAATLVLLPLVTGILEFAQLAVARQILAQATLDAGRSAAINVMDAGGVTDPTAEAIAVRLSLARGLLPLLGGRALEADRLAAAVLETMRPDRLNVSIEREVVQGVDVVVDRIEVTYCRELFFAPASHVLPELMRLWTVIPFDRACLEVGRVPLRVAAPATRSRYP